MATKGAEEPSESLKHKTWFLKVPIKCSCEGCKKKVRRILFKVEGVYSVDVDTKQQKVTVVGDVNADVLIKRLAKHGKEAKLWPQNTEPTEKKSGKAKNKDKQENPESGKPATVDGGATGGEGGGDKEVKPPVKVEAGEKVKESSKKGVEGSGGPGGGGGGDAKATEAAGEIASGGEKVKETKSEGKKPVPGSAGDKSVEKSGDDNKSAESGSVVEKKKSKGQKGKTTEGEPSSGPPPARMGSPTHESGPPHPGNQNPPRHQGHQYRELPHFNAPPPVMSYNMAHPSSSYSSYFPQLPQPYSYAYSQPDPAVHATPPDFHPYPSVPDFHQYPSVAQAMPPNYHPYPPPHQQLDSFEIISDENPNGCLIM
ncbi:hypothetical protein LguiA_007926 [Lonicera macranthoides]